jgi:hypothetical protein
MHIGLIGFLVCIPALVGSTDVAAMKIFFRAMRRFAFLHTNFRGT